jgi:hypothetical protein
MPSACLFFVISAPNSLAYTGKPALLFANLTKNLTAHLSGIALMQATEFGSAAALYPLLSPESHF